MVRYKPRIACTCVTAPSYLASQEAMGASQILASGSSLMELADTAEYHRSTLYLNHRLPDSSCYPDQ